MHATGVSATTMIRAINWKVKQAILTWLALVKWLGEGTDENEDLENATIEVNDANLGVNSIVIVERNSFSISPMRIYWMIEIPHLQIDDL